MKRLFCILTILILIFSLSQAQTLGQGRTNKDKKASSSIQPQAAGNAVTGSGTTGRLARWAGSDGSNTFTLGNSIVFEDKFGKVGIGTTAPTSLLTVQGMIETTLGGYKFPDGTVQTTSAANALLTVMHDATLTGNGTSASPLGVAVPMELAGSVPMFANSILTVTNTGDSGTGMTVRSGANGIAVIAFGGNSSNAFLGGTGVIGIGGDSSTNATAGPGVTAAGGNNLNAVGGVGLVARGGTGALGSFGADVNGGEGRTNDGGIGIRSFGGDGGLSNDSGSGGDGMIAVGGVGRGAGKSSGDGIFARAGTTANGATLGRAGAFLGLVAINGDLNVTGTKNFRIDHPLDPENKYLVHAAIESSEVLNVYSGNIKTDNKGEAVITLPDWFEALNKDYRYQLTVVGTFAQAIVSEEIKDNRFTIKTSSPQVKVSWQVTGVRSDAVMLKHPFKAEEVKIERERGTYLSPEAYGQPEERGVDWMRNPELMQRLRQQRLEAEQAQKQGKPNNR